MLIMTKVYIVPHESIYCAPRKYILSHSLSTIPVEIKFLLLYYAITYNSVSFNFSAFSATVSASIISWISPFIKLGKS